jgi:hypothetical protein
MVRVYLVEIANEEVQACSDKNAGFSATRCAAFEMTRFG